MFHIGFQREQSLLQLNCRLRRELWRYYSEIFSLFILLDYESNLGSKPHESHCKMSFVAPATNSPPPTSPRQQVMWLNSWDFMSTSEQILLKSFVFPTHVADFCLSSSSSFASVCLLIQYNPYHQYVRQKKNSLTCAVNFFPPKIHSQVFFCSQLFIYLPGTTHGTAVKIYAATYDTFNFHNSATDVDLFQSQKHH